MEKKNKKANSKEIKKDLKEETLTRRKAIKRIATIFAAAYVGPKVLGQASRGLIAYLSHAPYNPYCDAVYVDYSSQGYYSITYYTSVYSRYVSIPVPPPYSSSS